MPEVTHEALLQALNGFDEKDYFRLSEHIPGDYQNEISTHLLSQIQESQKAVLGFDIYQYSQYEPEQQNLVPFLFELLFNEAKRQVLEAENTFFEATSIDRKFISTGDGGFQIFDNPLQAVVFNTQFHAILLCYNSSRFYPKLRTFVGPIYLRTCVTYGQVFDYNDNHYGQAIILNARILSKDKLNRFLVDDSTHLWFLRKMNGIENITEITVERLMVALGLSGAPRVSTYFSPAATRHLVTANPTMSKYRSCHSQKIGTVHAKKLPLSIYNVEIQLYAYLMDENDHSRGDGMVVTIGNSNSSGITDESGN